MCISLYVCVNKSATEYKTSLWGVEARSFDDKSFLNSSESGIFFLLRISKNALTASSCQEVSLIGLARVTLFLPFLLDIYMAWSVSSSISSILSECSKNVATPILAVIWPIVSNSTLSIAFRILSAAIIAPSEVTPGRITLNSSPPILAAVSIERAFVFKTSAIVLIAVSP